MNWEAVTGLGTVFTGLVILVTVLLGARQLKATNRQLRQLRDATQLEGVMKIFDVLRSAECQEAQRFVLIQLSERMKDETFREEAGRAGGLNPDVHKERTVMNTFEEVGTYVRHGLVNGDTIYDLHGPIIIATWERLRDVIAATRQAYGGNDLWENFEFLYDRAKRYDEEHHPPT